MTSPASELTAAETSETTGPLEDPVIGSVSDGILTIDLLLQVLVQEGGSDLHLKSNNVPRLRVNGTLRPLAMAPLDGVVVGEMLEGIMHPRQRKILQRETSADFAYVAQGIGRFRVNVFVAEGGLVAVFRVIPSKVPMPHDINMPVEIRKFAQMHRGLVLVTGATGSGKSTTLAALINLINSYRRCHILTIEDPIEFIHQSNKALVNQREIGKSAKDFNGALRGALRQDPDVILVGEMRDRETISLAVTAAETGHLVFATLHTASAARSIDRIIGVFPPEEQDHIKVQLAMSLRAIVSQQLLVRKDGRGRVAAFEIMLVNTAVENLIRKGEIFKLDSELRTGRERGMQAMDYALQDLVEKELIDPAVALAAAFRADLLEAELVRQGRMEKTPKAVGKKS